MNAAPEKVIGVRPDLEIVLERTEQQQAPERQHVVEPRRARWTGVASSVGYAVAGVVGAVVAWQLLARVNHDVPGPLEVSRALGGLLASPLHDNGPNDKGLFLMLGSSLAKVFTGFALASIVGIPLGFLIGTLKRARQSINPLVQLLRPVSPLAWFPLALAAFRDAGRAGVFTIAVTALWPTLINTAVGVAGVPEDHRNVARVFRFDKVTYVRHVLVPNAMVSILTGLRLSMGIAWMVIVASEMLSGGTGIGFFVWDSYNNNNLADVVSAIVVVGMIGFVLDTAFARLAQRFDYVRSAA